MKKIKEFFNEKITFGEAFLFIFITAVAVAISMAIAFKTVIDSSGYKSNDKFDKLVEAASIIDTYFVGNTDSEDMMDFAIYGMLSSLEDRWSYYVPKDGIESYSSDANNNFVGIGVMLRATEKDGLVITKVYPGSGAEEAGIQVGDHITAAAGNSLIGLTTDESAPFIKGEEGTSVTLTVIDKDGNSSDISVLRKAIVIDPVTCQLIDEIGYIKIANFNAGSGDSFILKVDSLISQGAKAFIFDVRFNNGGQLTELCKMLDHLLPECTIFVSQDKAGTKTTKHSAPECIEKLPCAVLVNDSSFSAAEYFAAVLQEYEYADVIGTQTSGKGYSQTPITLSDGTLISLSTKSYYTPNGISLEGVGITPDNVLDVSSDEYAALYLEQLLQEDDSQLQLAIKTVKNSLSD